MQLGCGLRSALSEVKAESTGVCLELLTGQVLCHQVSGVGRTLDLDESNPPAQFLLLQPESPDIQVPDSANSSPFEDTQSRRRINVQSRVDEDAKVCCQ